MKQKFSIYFKILCQSTSHDLTCRLPYEANRSFIEQTESINQFLRTQLKF